MQLLNLDRINSRFFYGPGVVGWKGQEPRIAILGPVFGYLLPTEKHNLFNQPETSDPSLVLLKTYISKLRRSCQMISLNSDYPT